MSATSRRAEQSPGLNRGAEAALEAAGFSRRGFLKGAGALIVSFSLWGLDSFRDTAEAQFATGLSPGSPPPGQLDSWIAIGTDGSVTAYSGKEELGQGISTAQTQLVAEELCVPFDRVKLICCDTAFTPDEGTTSGSQSHPTNFNHNNLAQAAASAREALVRLASERLGVPVEGLVAEGGVVRAQGDPSKTVTYGALVGGTKFHLDLDPKAKRRNPREWTVLGKPVPRPDMAAMVTAEFEFVHNVRVAGMLHGRVVRPPTVGATLVSVDESSVKDMPGFVKVVAKKNFLGVVAEKPWQALQAANRLKVTWAAGPDLPDHANYFDHLRSQKPTRDRLSVDSKDVDAHMGEAATVLRATYHYPFQMHASMGTACAVADVQGEKVTIWSATQAVWYLRSTAATVLGVKPDGVRVIFTRGAGCYGINGADTVSYDAALLSQSVGKPVRVQLTRKDEMAWENYGYPVVADERAGVDAEGNIIAWDHEAWGGVMGNRPGMDTPGNVVTGFLAGFPPEPFVPVSPAPAPKTYANRANAVPSYVTGCVGDVCEGTGTVKAERVLMHNVASPFFTGPLRSPERLQNTFAHESFIDELAAHAKADPVAYRLRHLSHSRLIEVVKTVAKAAAWDARPSPKMNQRNETVSSGRGVSCVAYEGDNGYAAMVAYVEVDQTFGKISVKRIVVCNDSGPISNPDGLRSQMQGGALQGLSRALLEEVTWDNQKITSIDWRTYRCLPLGFDVPKVEVILVNQTDTAATGAGETAITLVASAVANAIFDATGARIRQAPFTPERVKAALAARA
jgi:nicotinate dehydrogenase subunit B